MSQTSLYQVIYTSCDDELFMFFEDKKDDKPQINLAILNLNVTRFKQEESIENRHFNKRGNLKHHWVI